VVANDIPACCFFLGALFIGNYMADRFIAAHCIFARNVPEQNPHLLEITAFA
jgi:hypothetical protein